MVHSKFVLKILRGTPNAQYFEEFELERTPGLNVTSALMEIQRHPVNRKMDRVAPVAWEQACLEEVCGSCSMLINGYPRQGCTALIEDILKRTGSNVIVLAPFTKFPLIRDLVVDRSKMFDDLKRIYGWVPVEPLHSESFGPPISPKTQSIMYIQSTCMTCGCCLEACPQYNNRSAFIGAAAINQVDYFNRNPTAKELKEERLSVMMQEGGVTDCGNAQNCAAVCPKKIPLTESIAKVGGDVSWQSVKNAFGVTKASSD